MIIFVFIRSMRTLILYTLILAYFEGRSQLDGTKWSINELYSSENLSFLPNVYFFKENVNLGRNINFNNGKFDIYENIPCLNVCFTSYYGNYFQIDSNKVVFQLDSIKTWGYAGCEFKTQFVSKVDTINIEKNHFGLRIYDHSIIIPKKDYYSEHGLFTPKLTKKSQKFFDVIKDFYNIYFENYTINDLFSKNSLSTYLTLRNILITKMPDYDISDRNEIQKSLKDLNQYFIDGTKK
jgi:hypothetical protein